MDLYQRPFEFMKGYTDTKNRKYMNLGLGTSPYPGKVGHGDYGPHQGGGLYYRPGIACPLETFHPDISLNICNPPRRMVANDHIHVAKLPKKGEKCTSCE